MFGLKRSHFARQKAKSFKVKLKISVSPLRDVTPRQQSHRLHVARVPADRLAQVRRSGFEPLRVHDLLRGQPVQGNRFQCRVQRPPFRLQVVGGKRTRPQPRAQHQNQRRMSPDKRLPPVHVAPLQIRLLRQEYPRTRRFLQLMAIPFGIKTPRTRIGIRSHPSARAMENILLSHRVLSASLLWPQCREWATHAHPLQSRHHSWFSIT